MAARSASGPYQFANLHDSRMCPTPRVGIDESRNVVLTYRRPSYFAMQNIFGLLDDEAHPAKISMQPNFKVTKRADPRDNRKRTLTSIRFVRDGKTLRFLWFSDERPSSLLEFDRVTVNFPGKVVDPVWVDMITGRVFEIPAESVKYENAWNKTGRGASAFTFNKKGVWTVELKFADNTTRTAHINIQASGLIIIVK